MAISVASTNAPVSTTPQYPPIEHPGQKCGTPPGSVQNTTSPGVVFDTTQQTMWQNQEDATKAAQEVAAEGAPPSVTGTPGQPSHPAGTEKLRCGGGLVPGEHPVKYYPTRDALDEFRGNSGAFGNGIQSQELMIAQRTYVDPRAEILLGSGNPSPTKSTISDQQIKDYWNSHTPDESFNAALLHNVSVDRIFEAVVDTSAVASASSIDEKKAVFVETAKKFLESKGVDTSTLNMAPVYVRGLYRDLRTEILFTENPDLGSKTSLSREEIQKIAADPKLTNDEKFQIALNTGTSVFDIASALHDFGDSPEKLDNLLRDLVAEAAKFAQAHGFSAKGGISYESPFATINEEPAPIPL